MNRVHINTEKRTHVQNTHTRTLPKKLKTRKRKYGQQQQKTKGYAETLCWPCRWYTSNYIQTKPVPVLLSRHLGHSPAHGESANPPKFGEKNAIKRSVNVLESSHHRLPLFILVPVYSRRLRVSHLLQYSLVVVRHNLRSSASDSEGGREGIAPSDEEREGESCAYQYGEAIMVFETREK